MRLQMSDHTKSRSPFFPGQPVPVELFAGRERQLDHILTRGAGQVAAGKPIAMYVQGEYGIGKSSIAWYAQRVAEKTHGLHAIHAELGGVATLDDLARCVVEATARSGAMDPTRSESIRNALGKYIGKQELFGAVSLDFAALRKDTPTLASALGILDFLRQILERLRDSGVKGLFLVLDEINGIADAPAFAHFIKGLVDRNALSESPVPLLLMLCGVEERRRAMIANHPPVDRIFDVVEIDRMSGAEMQSFFTQAFNSVSVDVTTEALTSLAHWSAGFPKIMHLIGDAAFWIDQDGKIDDTDAVNAVLAAAEEVGRKYVDQQVYRALRSDDYRSILRKIGKLGPGAMTFRRKDVAADLSETERGKFDNFLQRMKKLQVLRAGESPGEYAFNVRMVAIYVWLKSSRGTT